MRINRFLARCGVTSRRKAEKLITNGEVQVNKKVITNLAYDVNPEKDKVEIRGKTINLPSLKYYALNKPKGYTTTRNDPYAKHTIFELLPPDNSIFSVGRLDKDTTGLLILTNDGVFAQKIIHPTNKIEKKYQVITKNQLTDNQINKLRNTIFLEDGPAQAIFVKKLRKNKLEISIEEGRNRIIKRMILSVGNEVKELHRTAIGNICLDLEVGQYRKLTSEEISNYV